MIQWATGGVGQIAIRHMADNPAFELVGCYVTSAAKNGLDIGELAGREPIGLTATTDAEALLATEADCVNYVPLYVDIDQICRILRSGKNLVTPSGFSFRPLSKGRWRANSSTHVRTGRSRSSAPASIRASPATLSPDVRADCPRGSTRSWSKRWATSGNTLLEQ